MIQSHCGGWSFGRAGLAALLLGVVWGTLPAGAADTPPAPGDTPSLQQYLPPPPAAGKPEKAGEAVKAAPPVPVVPPGELPSLRLFMPKTETVEAVEAAPPVPVVPPGELPSLRLFMPKTETVEKVVEGPIVPALLDNTALLSDPAALLPTNALAYLETPSTAELSRVWGVSTIGRTLADERMARFFSVNPLGFADLFRDLPESFAPSDRTALTDAAIRLTRALPAAGGPAAFAVYADADNRLSYAYLVDVGGDRNAAWDRMEPFVTALSADFPALARESIRVGDFRDTFLSPNHAAARLEVGFVANFAYVTTQPGLVAAGAEGRLSSHPGLAKIREQARNRENGGTAFGGLVGFARPGGLLEVASDVSAAQRPVRALATMFGGARDPAATLLYGLQIDAGGALREIMLCPAASGNVVDFPGWLATYGRAVPAGGGWPALLNLPLSPRPVLVVAGQVERADTAAFYRAAQVIEFSVSDGTTATTQAARVAQALGDAPTGQAALGFLPSREGTLPWVALMPIEDYARAERVMESLSAVSEFSGVSLRRLSADHSSSSASGAERPAAEPVWALVGGRPDRLPEKAFVIGASDAELLMRWIDQLSAGRVADAKRVPLAAFAEGLPADASLAAWFDFPLWATVEFSELGTMLRRYYPRLSHVSGLPPLALFQRFESTSWSARKTPDGVLVSVAGALPTGPGLALGTAIGAPSWIRERGREDMAAAAGGLRRLWLELELYRNRHGHFPASLEDFATALPVALRPLLISPAAGAAEREGLSTFEYVAGISPVDEPSTPIMYDRKPWYNEYENWFAEDGEPSATGAFRAFRLLLSLDGRVRPVDEDTFQRRILPRLPPRE